MIRGRGISISISPGSPLRVRQVVLEGPTRTQVLQLSSLTWSSVSGINSSPCTRPQWQDPMCAAVDSDPGASVGTAPIVLSPSCAEVLAGVRLRRVSLACDKSLLQTRPRCPYLSVKGLTPWIALMFTRNWPCSGPTRCLPVTGVPQMLQNYGAQRTGAIYSSSRGKGRTLSSNDFDAYSVVAPSSLATL